MKCRNVMFKTAAKHTNAFLSWLCLFIPHVAYANGKKLLFTVKPLYSVHAILRTLFFYRINARDTKHTLIFFYKQRKKIFLASFMLIFFIIVRFYCSIVLPIVLQSNLQPNYVYRQYAYKKK